MKNEKEKKLLYGITFGAIATMVILLVVVVFIIPKYHQIQNDLKNVDTIVIGNTENSTKNNIERCNFICNANFDTKMSAIDQEKSLCYCINKTIKTECLPYMGEQDRICSNITGATISNGTDEVLVGIFAVPLYYTRETEMINMIKNNETLKCYKDGRCCYIAGEGKTIAFYCITKEQQKELNQTPKPPPITVVINSSLISVTINNNTKNETS